MRAEEADIIVAGHICLDLIPTLDVRRERLDAILAPGQLALVGPAVISTGGTVANTGLALHRLGTRVRLVGKVGGDILGRATLDVLREHAVDLAESMIVAPQEYSSYTIILSAPGLDRTFLHYPGPNDTFRAQDVPDAAFAGARLFHFGYPTLMRQMFVDGGTELLLLFQRARRNGLITSLDVSMPDPGSEAGQVDWLPLLEQTLPQVDCFLPSVEELLYMVDRPRYALLERAAMGKGVLTQVDGDLLSDLGDRLIAMGVAIAGVKLGDQGIYLRTTRDPERLAILADRLLLDTRVWRDRELLSPAFSANLVGTTGAGDCAIAGFLTGLLHGLSPEATLTGAVGVGACNVEAADAISGVPSWGAVQQRIAAGWGRMETRLPLRGWGWSPTEGLWFGPRDRGGLLSGADAKGDA